MFDVELGCDNEARQILQASLTNTPVRHAVMSLRTLREDLETSGDGPTSVVRQTPNFCTYSVAYTPVLLVALFATALVGR